MFHKIHNTAKVGTGALRERRKKETNDDNGGLYRYLGKERGWGRLCHAISGLAAPSVPSYEAFSFICHFEFHGSYSSPFLLLLLVNRVARA